MKNFLKKSFGVVAGVASVAATSAYAALPTAATDALATAGTTVTDSSTAVWPYVGAGIAASLTFKIVKKYANKIG